MFQLGYIVPILVSVCIGFHPYEGFQADNRKPYIGIDLNCSGLFIFLSKIKWFPDKNIDRREPGGTRKQRKYFHILFGNPGFSLLNISKIADIDRDAGTIPQC